MPDEMNKREVILTIREYENSVAMPEGERVTYLDPRGGVHLKDGDDKASDYTGHAAKCAEYLRFGDEVDAVTCGEYPRSSAVKFCDTPELFVQAGFRPLPMLYTQRQLRDAIRPKSSYDPHRHGLTVEQMKRLPELMEHPVMLCDSPAREDTMLVVLRDVDCDDLPLIMAVRPDGRGYYEAGEIETNFILAVYGRTNFPRYFDNLITPDRVVYYDEERGRELNALAKLHLLRSHIVEPDLNRNVMKDISEIEGYEDVVTWCRDFFSATDSIHADIGVSPLLYRSERNLLMSLVSYLFDYLPSEDLTTDALLTLLSMAETKPDDYGWKSPLDLLFMELETGKRYAARPDREETIGLSRNLLPADDSYLVQIPSPLKRRDGYKPSECEYFPSPDKDFTLRCWLPVKSLSRVDFALIVSDLTCRTLDFKYRDVSVAHPLITDEDKSIAKRHKPFGFRRDKRQKGQSL